MGPHTNLEGDTLVVNDSCEKKSSPVSPKTVIPTMGEFILTSKDFRRKDVANNS